MTDTGYVQTGAAVVDYDNLYPACGDAGSTIDGNSNTGVCLNGSYVTLDFNPTGTDQLDALWVKMYGAAGTLSQGYGPLVFSLFNWTTNQFEEVHTYNAAVPEIWHWIEFQVQSPLANLVKSDGTVRLKIYSVNHTGTSGRVREVYVRAVHDGITSIESMPVRVIDGIGDRYADKLTTEGIDTVVELYMIHPHTLAPLVNMSVSRLEEFRRKADFAVNTRFNRTTYQALFDHTLNQIIEAEDGTLHVQTGIPLHRIASLKTGIATLYVALDNDQIESLPLSHFELL